MLQCVVCLAIKSGHKNSFNSNLLDSIFWFFVFLYDLLLKNFLQLLNWAFYCTIDDVMNVVAATLQLVTRKTVQYPGSP